MCDALAAGAVVVGAAPSSAPQLLWDGATVEISPADPAAALDQLAQLSEQWTPETARAQQLLARQRTFVLMRDGRVDFKADLGAAAGDVCQIQGVWVRPELRGRGLAAPCMAAVVEQALQRFQAVSLYVNDYNTAALRTYERVGFQRHGTFATVLF